METIIIPDIIDFKNARIKIDVHFLVTNAFHPSFNSYALSESESITKDVLEKDNEIYIFDMFSAL